MNLFYINPHILENLLVEEEYSKPYDGYSFTQIFDIAGLNKKERIIIRCVYEDGMRQEDIKDVVCINQGNVSKTLKRAFNKIRVALEDMYR